VEQDRALLFCHIAQNWRGRPLADRLAVVELIGATTTKTGLKVESALGTRTCRKGVKISNVAMKCLGGPGAEKVRAADGEGDVLMVTRIDRLARSIGESTGHRLRSPDRPPLSPSKRPNSRSTPALQPAIASSTYSACSRNSRTSLRGDRQPEGDREGQARRPLDCRA
jgi:hypothetical protein